MLVLIGLIVSLIVALIIAKILNRKFSPIWLCVFWIMGAIAISTLTIMTIVEYGIINESMLCLIAAVMCWVSSITMWMSVYAMWESRV